MRLLVYTYVAVLFFSLSSFPWHSSHLSSVLQWDRPPRNPSVDGVFGSDSRICDVFDKPVGAGSPHHPGFVIIEHGSVVRKPPAYHTHWHFSLSEGVKILHCAMLRLYPRLVTDGCLCESPGNPKLDDRPGPPNPTTPKSRSPGASSLSSSPGWPSESVCVPVTRDSEDVCPSAVGCHL
ncbi:hypothetical protein BKA56DRAFT_235546 [Ilyonectria sp. MPI-CAGE-AT-0026]|nr:hypothetical protein BKA56DRAFT_235546 [Ilyonectria sp. MPI-CAGE-AT-0026]